jgi:hypothetical protein
MIQITKVQLNDLFNGGQTYEQIAQDFSITTETEITDKMVMNMFRAAGFNLRNRSRKVVPTQWFQIIDQDVVNDITQVNQVESLEVA